jgi:hypothetical protein
MTGDALAHYCFLLDALAQRCLFHAGSRVAAGIVRDGQGKVVIEFAKNVSASLEGMTSREQLEASLSLVRHASYVARCHASVAANMWREWLITVASGLAASLSLLVCESASDLLWQRAILYLELAHVVVSGSHGAAEAVLSGDGIKTLSHLSMIAGELANQMYTRKRLWREGRKGAWRHDSDSTSCLERSRSRETMRIRKR